MASDSDDTKTLEDKEADPNPSGQAPLAVEEGDDDVGRLPAVLGVDRYVHAAFFVAALIASYLAAQILGLLWSTLTGIPEAVRAVPLLLEYNEDERGTICLVIGTVVGVLSVLRYYRRPSVKGWALGVAQELGRVTWPARDTVTNGTLVVIVASLIATIYVTLLDRFWGYLTNLVYGA